MPRCLSRTSGRMIVMDIQYYLLPSDSIDLFSPLLPAHIQSSLRQQSNTYAIGAVCGQQACGVLVFDLGEMLCNILHLAVAPSMRRKGVGQGLVNFLCSNAKQENLGVLCSFSAPDESAPLYRFFQERWDFTVAQDTGEVCRIPLSQLEQLKLPRASCTAGRIEPFFQMPSDLRNAFLSDLSEQNREFFQGLETQSQQLLPPLCLCAADDSSIRAALFCHQRDGDVILSFLCARPGNGTVLIGLLSRLRDLLIQAADRVPYLWISSVTPETQALLEAVAPQREIVSRFYLAGWDETW